MATLRARMEQHLADWQADLPQGSGWPEFFKGCPSLDFVKNVPDHLEIADDAPVWPGRRNAPHPSSPAGAHICHAFDCIEPRKVRVVVLGQDPYPKITQATGRAFEDGQWRKGGRPEEITKSLKSLMLAAIATRDADLFRAGGWSVVKRRLRREGSELPALDEYFDGLAEESVLFVNAAWTHTRKVHIENHLTLWRPVLQHLLKKLAAGATEPLVFVLLGKKAQKRFLASGAESAAGSFWGTRVMKLDLVHPRDFRFFKENPWSRVNKKLLECSKPEFEWWSSEV